MKGSLRPIGNDDGAGADGRERDIFYAFHFLQYVGTGSSVKERINVIGRFNHDLKEPVASLLDSEVATLKVIEAPDEKGKDAAIAIWIS